MKRLIIYIAIFVIALVLRVYKIDTLPHGFNADEAAIGYNAWSVLETGMDEHGQRWPLVFRSFDDYKPPLYFYMTMPSVSILGLSQLAVRLPNIILGSLTAVFLGLFVDRLFKKDSPGPLVAISLAIMPWHILFSRGGWEVNAASALLVFGLWIMSLKDDAKHLILGGVLMILAMYTYHSARIYIPLLGLVYVLIYRKTLVYPQNWRGLIIPFAIWTLVAMPLVGQMLSKEGQSRFSGVSIFADQGPLWEALEMRREHGGQNIYVRLVHSKYITYSLRFLENYLSHYSIDFLIIKGDVIDRNKISGNGQIYLTMAPLLLAGIGLLYRRNNKLFKFAGAFLVFAPIASSLTFQSPHALRSEVMALPLAIFVGVGAYYLMTIKKIGWFVGAFLGLLLLFETTRLWHYYQRHYPIDYPIAWQYGFSQIGEYLKENESKYNEVIISTRYDQPYILTAFYLQYPPQKLQNELIMSNRDNFGFSTGTEFGKFKFKKITSEDFLRDNALIVVADEGREGGKLIKEIKVVDTTVFKLYETN